MDSSFMTMRATLHSKTFSLMSCDVVSSVLLHRHSDSDSRRNVTGTYFDISPLLLAQLLELIHEYPLRRFRHLALSVGGSR